MQYAPAEIIPDSAIGNSPMVPASCATGTANTGPGEWNQHPEQDGRNANHMDKNIERVLMRCSISSQHVHQFAVLIHFDTVAPGNRFSTVDLPSKSATLHQHANRTTQRRLNEFAVNGAASCFASRHLVDCAPSAGSES
jgi:hypothetical protein